MISSTQEFPVTYQHHVYPAIGDIGGVQGHKFLSPINTPSTMKVSADHEVLRVRLEYRDHESVSPQNHRIGDLEIRLTEHSKRLAECLIPLNTLGAEGPAFSPSVVEQATKDLTGSEKFVLERTFDLLSRVLASNWGTIVSR